MWLIWGTVYWTDGSSDEDLDALIRVAGPGAFAKTVPLDL